MPAAEDEEEREMDQRLIRVSLDVTPEEYRLLSQERERRQGNEHRQVGRRASIRAVLRDALHHYLGRSN